MTDPPDPPYPAYPDPTVFPQVSDPPRYYRVEIDRVSKKWLTDNRRVNYYAKAKMVKVWREVATWRAYRQIGSPRIGRARVICELRFSTSRRRDPNNWSATAKPVMDGLVDAGVFPDDDASHVIGPDMRLGPAQPMEQLIVHIWNLEAQQ